MSAADTSFEGLAYMTKTWHFQLHLLLHHPLCPSHLDSCKSFTLASSSLSLSPIETFSKVTSSNPVCCIWSVSKPLMSFFIHLSNNGIKQPNNFVCSIITDSSTYAHCTFLDQVICKLKSLSGKLWLQKWNGQNLLLFSDIHLWIVLKCAVGTWKVPSML